MVKNLPTVERSTKIRFGKNCTEDQAENTIVFNASDAQLNIEFTNSVYMTPLRIREDLSDRNITVLAYNQVTKEVMDSGAVAEDILNFSLEAAVINGNVTSNTVSFNDTVTSVTTLSNVGVANGSPIHTLDVGSTFNVDINGSNLLTVLGNTYIQDNLVVDGNMTVNGALTTVNTVNTIVKDPIIELGKDNVSSDIGIIMYRPNSNVAIGFREGSSELVLAYTESSSYGSTIIPRDSESLDVRVYGRVLTESNVGILNVTPTHTLDVGSNLFVDEFGSNILYVTGNTHTTDILSVGDKLGVKTAAPEAELHVTGNTYVSSNLTVDTNTFHVDTVNNKVGVGTTTPEKTLHVQGDIKFNGTLFDTNGEFVTSPWVTTGTHIYYNVGNVGFGTNANIGANVHVNGNVYATANVIAGFDTDTTSCFGRAALGYAGESDHASFAHVDKNTTANYALKQTAAGVTHLNTSASQHIRFSVAGTEKARLTGTGDLKVGSNFLYVDASEASVGLGTATPNSNLHVVGNAFVSSNLTVSGGLITNMGGVIKKIYSHSRTVASGFVPSIDINFTSNIFYAKITAQLIDGDEDLSTMILEVSGGRKNGETPTKNIAIGTKNIFGDQTNTNPWSPTVATTGNKITLTASNALDAQDSYDIFIEYMSSNPDGKVVSIIDTAPNPDLTHTFGY